MDEINIPLYQLPNDGVEIIVKNIDYFNNCACNVLHRHNYYELMFVEQGRGEQLIDFKKHKLASNTIYLISPNQVHLIDRTKEVNGLLLRFSVDCLATLSIDPYVLNDIWQLELGSEKFKEFYDLALSIESHIDPAVPANRQIALHYLSILLLKLVNSDVDELKRTSSEDAAIFSRFSSFLEENFRTNRAIKAYEEHLDIPYKKLNAIVKRKTGKTVLQVIHDRLLLEIKRMLAHGKLSQKEISYQLNFDSTATFNQFVKKQTSCTPNEIKQRLLIT